MTTAYTSLLGLALPVTGELAGTWGDTVNDYITKYLDASVAGTQTISGSQTAVTLSVTTNANLSQVGSGATGSAQYNIINCTGNPASLLTITAPAASKTYVVVNATSTNQQVKIVGAGPTTGVTLDAGEKAVIAWNGSDFIKIATSAVDGVSTISFGTTGLTPSTATSGAVTVAGTLVAANGGTGQSTYTTGDLLYATGSTALSKLGIGTNGQILTSTGTAPQWSTLSGVAVTTFSAGTTGFTPSVATSGAITLAGTLATTNGGTGLTSFTANGVVYASSTSALTTGSALSFDGTNVRIGAGVFQSAYRFSNFAGNATAAELRVDTNTGEIRLFGDTNYFQTFYANNAEAMRLTSTGLTTQRDATIYGVTVGRGAGAVGSNTAVGISALAANTTGNENTAIGYRAAIATTTGTGLTAVGSGALFTNTTGSASSAFGQNALVFNTTGANNTALGNSALFSNTTASDNTAVGYQAGYSNTTGTENAFLGQQAGYGVTTASYNTAIGSLALKGGTVTGERNTAVGRAALYVVTSGASNTAVGMNAMIANTTGSYNVAIGETALNANTTASSNTAVGYQAGYTQTTGANNTYLGYQAGYLNTTASGQTFVGNLAGRGSTGANNTVVGAAAGYSLTTGTLNTFVGGDNVNGGSGYYVTSGSCCG